MSCPINGEMNCKCLIEHEDLQVDIKTTMRKLFTDHGVFTAFVLKSIVDHVNDVPALLPRLMQNQEDIGNELKPYIGQQLGHHITTLLKEHIKLAGDVMKAAVNSSSNLNHLINQLMNNSNQVAAGLHAINPDMLPLDEMKIMFHDHNDFVIKMCQARIAKKYKEEIRLYDGYFNELMMMSDQICDAL